MANALEILDNTTTVLFTISGAGETSAEQARVSEDEKAIAALLDSPS